MYGLSVAEIRHRRNFPSITEWKLPMSPSDTLKYRIFSHFWEMDYFLTNGGKFGGDFLIYPGICFVCYAVTSSLIVIVWKPHLFAQNFNLSFYFFFLIVTFFLLCYHFSYWYSLLPYLYEPHGQTYQIFVHVTSDGIAIRYVLLVLWMMSCFYTVGQTSQNNAQRYV